jgi:hypothetical protein
MYEYDTPRTGTAYPGHAGAPQDQPVLAEQHLEYLEQRAVTAEVAAERGYASVGGIDDAVWRRLGAFAPSQRQEGLLIPLCGVDGSNHRYVLRPTSPRLDKKGKPRKYEYPAGQKPMLDVPPRCLPQLSDLLTPLFISEGAAKVDCLAGLGYCALDVWGVHNWYTNPEHGGFATIKALPDWGCIPLDGRLVYLCFDSDSFTKPSVGLALRRLANFLTGRGALVYIVKIPDAPDSWKQGVDDYIARYGAEAFAQLVADAEPHGSAGMVRKLQARVRQLEQERSAIFEALRNPKLDASERIAGVLAINEVGSALSRGAAAPVPVTIYAVPKDKPEQPFGLAVEWGLGRNTVSRALATVTAPGAPLVKETVTERTADGQVRSTTYLGLADCGTVHPGQYRALARFDPAKAPEQRHGGPRTKGVARCPDCPPGTPLRTTCTRCGSIVDEVPNPTPPAPTHQDGAPEEPEQPATPSSYVDSTKTVHRVPPVTAAPTHHHAASAPRAASRPWSEAAADRMVGRAHAALEATRPAGCLLVDPELAAAGDQVEAAYEAEDLVELRHALERWVAVGRRHFAEYRAAAGVAA